MTSPLHASDRNLYDDVYLEESKKVLFVPAANEAFYYRLSNI